MIKPIKFNKSKMTLTLIDQRKLPRYEELKLTSFEQVARAIEDMVVRGAPAIGITAAYGLTIGVSELGIDKKSFAKVQNRLAETRPTASNLFWALRRMKDKYESCSGKTGEELLDILSEEADQILEEDIENNKKLGNHGAILLDKNPYILTHCNAGGMATGGYGTALGVIRAAEENGLNPFVWVDETRPRLQGARITAWELENEDISYKVIVDNTAASLMKKGKIDYVITGADRIALNGDAANKIGTYSLAVNAGYHNIPFFIAAPYSTIDFDLKSGSEIPIEERNPGEVLEINGINIAPKNAGTYNPAFDVTPHELISGIITEKGFIEPPFEGKLKD